MKFLTALIAAVVLSASAASAATVTYNFQASGTNGATINYSSGGVDMTVTGAVGNVAVTNNGLGVTGNPEGGRLGLGESLTFDFGTTLVDQISGLIFESGGQTEQFGITIGGVSTVFTLPAAAGSSFVNIDFTSLIPTGGVSSFTIFGLEPDAAGNRGVKVGEITVNALTAIPLPAGGLLLLSGLGALTLRGRRTRS